MKTDLALPIDQINKLCQQWQIIELSLFGSILRDDFHADSDINLATITQGVNELRNHYGTGYGKVAGTKGLLPRHARLAVGAASTLAVFLVETDNERSKTKTKD
jgi:hypothetical protein